MYINIRKFFILCLLDVVLMAIVNERYKFVGFVLVVPLFFISFMLSTENPYEDMVKEFSINDSKPAKSRHKKETCENFSDYEFFSTSAPNIKRKSRKKKKKEDDDIPDDIFDSGQKYYYKNADKSPKYPSFDKLKSTYDYYFIKPNTTTTTQIKMDKIQLSRKASSISRSGKKSVKFSNFQISGPEFPKKSEFRTIVYTIQNDDKIFLIAQKIRKFLEDQSASIQKGIDFLAFLLVDSIRDNPGDRRPAFFGFALSHIFPKNDKYQEFFENCMYQYCKQANPNKRPDQPYFHRVRGIIDESEKEVYPASILFCYWCFINETEKLFKWAEIHTVIDDKNFPDFSIGTALFQFIQYAGKKLYETDKSRVIEMTKNALDFLRYYSDKDEMRKINEDWIEYIDYYKKYPTFFEDFEKYINADDIKKLDKDYECYKSKLSHLKDQKKS